MRRSADNRDASAPYTGAIRSHKCENSGDIYGCRCQQEHKNRPPHYDCGKSAKVLNENMNMSPVEKMRILQFGKKPR